ncbi:MAG: ABC transporter ATP-binding protein [Planctomycetota bacterium]
MSDVCASPASANGRSTPVSLPDKPTKDHPAGLGGSGATLSNWTLTRRLLGLAWVYRAASIKVILLQFVLLAMALAGLGFLGLGIDVIGYAFDPVGPENLDGAKPPRWPFGLAPPGHWDPLEQVGLVAGLIFGIGAVRFGLDRWSAVSVGTLVQDIVVDMRGRVYDKLQRLSFRFFDANESGSIINRVTGDVQMVRMFVDRVLIQVVMLAISLVFFAGFMMSLHVTLTLVCLATTPMIWGLTAWFSKTVKPAYRENRRLFDHAVRVLSENAQGVHVVKGFARQAREVEKFNAASDAVAAQKNWIFRRIGVFVPVIFGLSKMNIMLLLLVGGWVYIHDEAFTFGMLVVFSGLLQQFSSQVGNIAQIANAVQASLTGAQRVFEVLDTPVEIASPESPRKLSRARGEVEFDGVDFDYGESKTPALSEVSFRAESGQMVAILGATGAGKSTLLSLLPRFYDPTAGRVLIDGVDLRGYDLDDVRRNIGLVFQESFLFSNTIAENIAFGHPDASREQVERAARIAAAHDFVVNDLSNGYDTLLTEGGANLSGGQRQRIAIARALLLDPPVLIMDDPTAAIDPETEHEILDAMARAMKGRTTFVVAHRMSTLRRADLILVLDKGRLVESGTHEELMGSGGHYRGAANLQAADDESRRLLGLSHGEGVQR